MAQKGLSQALRALVIQLYAYFFFFMLLWGIPICSQPSYAEGTSTKLLPCSTLTSSADSLHSCHRALTFENYFLTIHLCCPVPSPPPFFATCRVTNPKSNEQSWEISQTQLSVQLLSTTLTAPNMCIASPIGFCDLFCGLLSSSILCSHHLTSQSSLFWD